MALEIMQIPFGSQYSAVLLLIALSYWHLKKA